MSTKIYHLHKWSVQEDNDPYLAPEVNSKRLVGYRNDEDRQVITGPIVAVDGNHITTYSGSVYVLQDIDPEYLTWMTDNGYAYDPEHPITLRKMS